MKVGKFYKTIGNDYIKLSAIASVGIARVISYEICVRIELISGTKFDETYSPFDIRGFNPDSTGKHLLDQLRQFGNEKVDEIVKLINEFNEGTQ